MSRSEMPKPIRVGLVGVGHWGLYAHLPVLKLLPQYEIVAVSSRRRESAEALAQKWEVPHVFDRYEDLVRHSDVDLVVVLPPAPHHAEVARAAIAEGKNVYCEWPLTPSTEESANLRELADKAGVRHVVGLQRRLAPSARYLHDLLAEGYVGRVRSVRLHVSENLLARERSSALGFTVDPANFSNIVSIYGGHFLDLLFSVVGDPQEFNALTVNQFDEITLIETGETLPTTVPDQLLFCGKLRQGAVFSVHVEGGKRNNFGIQWDITGTEGDLRLSNVASFHNLEDHRIEGAQGVRLPLKPLPVPDRYNWLPPSDLPVSALDLANLYVAYARDSREGTQLAPTFAQALKLHRILDAITESSQTGRRVDWVSRSGGDVG